MEMQNYMFGMFGNAAAHNWKYREKMVEAAIVNSKCSSKSEYVARNND